MKLSRISFVPGTPSSNHVIQAQHLMRAQYVIDMLFTKLDEAKGLLFTIKFYQNDCDTHVGGRTVVFHYPVLFSEAF